jgi:protoporphyrinogen oxidase
VAVLGAGPEGLAAGHLVALRGRPGTVFEPEGELGGIARTNEYRGYRFDLGGHRFRAELDEVGGLWEELLGEELLPRRLLSRTYSNGRYLARPAATGVLGRLRGARLGGGPVDTGELFLYPRLGAGQMWEAFRTRLEGEGVPIRLNERCVAIHHSERRVEEIVLWRDGRLVRHAVEALLSTLPVGQLVARLRPRPPDAVLAAARRLRHRDCCLVALVTTEAEPFPDNWIYLHGPGTRAARVHNVAAWSESMVVPGTACLAVEYVCAQGDELWEMRPEEAVAMATSELAGIGLIDPARVVDGTKVAVARAYPVDDEVQRAALAEIRSYLDRFENLETFGRDGSHQPGEEDHVLRDALLAATGVLGERAPAEREPESELVAV